MKYLTLVLIVLFTGCTTKTEFGHCVGLNGTKDPKLHYSYDAINIVLSVVFIETVFVPVIVVLNELECPDANLENNKNENKTSK